MNYSQMKSACQILLSAVIFAQLAASSMSNAQLQGKVNEREPISLRNMRPYDLLGLQFAPETPDALRSKESRFSLQFDISNNLLAPDPRHGAVVIEDNEMQRLNFRWRRGIGGNLETEVAIPLLWRNGGVLDGILSAYHGLIGFKGNQDDNPAGRESFRKYQSRLQLADSNGNVLIDQGSAFGIGDLTLTLKKVFNSRTERAATALRFGLKIPTGNSKRLLGSGAADIGVSFDGRYRIGRDFTLYFNIGGVLTGRTSAVPNRESGVGEGFLGLEYHPNRRDSFFAQIDSQSPFLRTGNSFADQTNTTATFGYKRVLSEKSVLSLAFSENGDIHHYGLTPLSSIGPDITFSFGIEWK